LKRELERLTLRAERQWKRKKKNQVPAAGGKKHHGWGVGGEYAARPCFEKGETTVRRGSTTAVGGRGPIRRQEEEPGFGGRGNGGGGVDVLASVHSTVNWGVRRRTVPLCTKIGLPKEPKRTTHH